MKKLGLLLLAVMMISLSSCGGDHAEKAKDAAGEAVEATKEAASEATEATKEAASEAAEATKEAAEDATEAVKDAAKDAKEAAEGAVDAAKEAVSDVNGKTLFAANGCVACHNPQNKTVGPSIKEIGAAYAGKKDDLVKFLRGEAKAVVDPAQFAVMQPNLATTKKMTDAEVGAIADYMLSVK